MDNERVTGEEMTISIVTHLSREVSAIKKYLFEQKAKYIQNPTALDDMIDAICVSMRDNSDEWEMVQVSNIYKNSKRNVSLSITDTIFGCILPIYPSEPKLSKEQKQRIKNAVYVLISNKLQN